MYAAEQIRIASIKYFEGTVNPSNAASKKNFRELEQLLNTKCKETCYSTRKILKMMIMSRRFFAESIQFPQKSLKTMYFALNPQ